MAQVAGPSVRATAFFAALRAAVFTRYFLIAFAVEHRIAAGALVAFIFLGAAALASFSLKVTGRAFGISEAFAFVDFTFYHRFFAGLAGFTGGGISVGTFGIFVRTGFCRLAQISGPSGLADTFFAALRTAVFAG